MECPHCKKNIKVTQFLSPIYLEVFRCVYVHDMTVKETAIMLGRNESSIYRSLHRMIRRYPEMMRYVKSTNWNKIRKIGTSNDIYNDSVKTKW